MERIKGILGKVAGSVMLVGIVGGLFVLVTIPFEMVQKARAESWPSRKAVITQSYADRTRSGRDAAYWQPRICGTFKDTGGKFCVTRIRYGGFRFGEGKAQAFDAVAKYPVGREVDVYYAADDPRNTVLEAVSPWTEMYTLLGLALGFLLLPVGLWVFRKTIEPQRYGAA